MSTLTSRDAPRPSDHALADEADRALLDELVPPPRSRRWAAMIVVFAAGLVALVAFATISGTAVPRLSATTSSWSAVRGGAVRFTFTLHNDGLRGATITALGLDAAGLDHGRTDVHFPVHLAPHHDMSITATFTGFHCATIRQDQFKAGIRVTARGDFPFAKTVTAALMQHFTKPFEGWRSYSGADPLQIGWPAGITQHACTGA